MGTILASSILARVSIDLNDTANVRWPQSELLAWLNDGQREAAVVMPQCSTVTRSVLLTASKSKQSIPADAIALLELVRNTGADGLTPGLPITQTDRTSMDIVAPTWHTDTNALGSVAHEIPSSDRNSFYVYPKAPASAWYVEGVFSVTPPEVAAVGNAIGLNDLYATALGFYVLSRAYGKNKEDAAASALSASYRAQFLAAMGVSTTG